MGFGGTVLWNKLQSSLGSQLKAPCWLSCCGCPPRTGPGVLDWAALVLGGGCCSVFPWLSAWDRLLVGGGSESCIKYKIHQRWWWWGKQRQLNCRGEHLVWKSCADRTNASVPPYALQLLHVVDTVEQQVGSYELKSESFTSRTLARFRSLKSPLVESLSPGNVRLVETSGCERGLGERVGSGRSTASLEPCPASGRWWASVNLTATSGSLFRASFPVCRAASKAFGWLGSIKKAHSCSFVSLCYWNKMFLFQLWSKPSASSLPKQNSESGQKVKLRLQTMPVTSPIYCSANSEKKMQKHWDYC